MSGAPGRALAWVCATGTRTVLSLLLLSGFLQFFRLGTRGLFEPDEGRYAEIPREMIALSDWITPHLNYVPYFEKPPLVYWMTAGLYRLLGECAFTARFASAIFTVLAVIVTGVFGRRLLGPRAGWLGGALLATAMLPIGIGRIAMLDAVVAALITIAIFAFHAGLRAAPESLGRRNGWLLLGYVAAALATLVKGPVGAALPGLVIGLDLLLSGRLRDIRHLRLVSGAIVYLGITAPWFVVVSRRNPGFLDYFFLHETLMRYVSTVHRRTGSVFYYVPVLLAGLAPWSLLIPKAVGLAWRQRHDEEGREAWFLALWAAAVFLFFSFAGSKLPGYLLPAFPPLALLVARTFVPRPGAALPPALLRTWWLDAGLGLLVAVALAGLFVPGRILAAASEGITGDVRLIGAVTLAVAGFGILARRRGRPAIAAMCLGGWIVVAAPLFVCVSERIEDRYSVAPIARRFASRIPSDAGVVQYRGYSEGLPFYLKRRIILYRHVGELYEGYMRSKPGERDRWFITEKKDLARILAGERRVFVLTSRRDEPELVAEFPALRRLDESARYALFATRPPGGSSPSSGTPSGDR